MSDLTKLTLLVRSADGESVRAVTFERGAVVNDTSATKRRPQASISDLVGVEAVDEDGELVHGAADRSPGAR